MSHFNPESIIDSIDKDMAWRKKELAYLLSSIPNIEIKFEAHKTVLRSAYVMLYAHWEGCIKINGNTYFNFVKKKRNVLNNLAKNFQTIAIRHKIRIIHQLKTHEKCEKEINNMFESMGERAKFPEDVLINTSNLLPAEFRDIIHMLGFSYNYYEPKEKPFIERLVQNRNTIAHGNWIEAKLTDYEVMHREILMMMSEFVNQIQNAISEKSYLKK